MKDFFFIFRSSAEEMAKLSESGRKEYMDKWTSWFKKLTEEGRYENVGERLISAEAKTIMSSGKVITDGPYPESKEIIGGFAKIKAENIDDAAKVGMNCPIFTVNGSLEIRTGYYM